MNIFCNEVDKNFLISNYNIYINENDIIIINNGGNSSVNSFGLFLNFILFIFYIFYLFITY